MVSSIETMFDRWQRRAVAAVCFGGVALSRAVGRDPRSEPSSQHRHRRTWRTDLEAAKVLSRRADEKTPRGLALDFSHRLTLTDRAYSIKRGLTTGNGNVTVRGSDIVFSASPLCDGEGAYRWSFQSGSLRFVAVSPDPCGGHVEILQDQTYQRG